MWRSALVQRATNSTYRPLRVLEPGHSGGIQWAGPAATNCRNTDPINPLGEFVFFVRWRLFGNRGRAHGPLLKPLRQQIRIAHSVPLGRTSRRSR